MCIKGRSGIDDTSATFVWTRKAISTDSHLCTFSVDGLLLAQRHSRKHGSSRRTERQMWSGVEGVRRRCGGIEKVTSFCCQVANEEPTMLLAEVHSMAGNIYAA